MNTRRGIRKCKREREREREERKSDLAGEG